MEEILLFLKPLLEGLLGKYGWLVQVVAIIGALRLFIKPLMSMAQAYVSLTPSVKDDEFLKKIQESSIYKMVSYLLDWFGSIKLPKKDK